MRKAARWIGGRPKYVYFKHVFHIFVCMYVCIYSKIEIDKSLKSWNLESDARPIRCDLVHPFTNKIQSLKADSLVISRMINDGFHVLGKRVFFPPPSPQASRQRMDRNEKKKTKKKNLDPKNLEIDVFRFFFSSFFLNLSLVDSLELKLSVPRNGNLIRFC